MFDTRYYCKFNGIVYCIYRIVLFFIIYITEQKKKVTEISNRVRNVYYNTKLYDIAIYNVKRNSIIFIIIIVLYIDGKIIV